MDVKEEGLIHGAIGDHWYYKSKARAIAATLKGVPVNGVLDVGAGSGFFSKYLLIHTAAKEATCVDTAYEKDSEETAGGKKIRFVRSGGKTDADLVLLMDVLEHVDDDNGLLTQVMAGTNAGTHCLITVPAFQSLFTEHDRALKHFRRYRRSQLAGEVAAAGLQILDSGYLFASLLAPRAAGALKEVAEPTV